MAGTREGGIKSVAKVLARDPDHYRRIGRTGGKNGNTGGFYNNPELARAAGAIGGRNGKRGKGGIMRKDSIRVKGLEAHVNEYCEKRSIPFNYDNLVEWIEGGESNQQIIEWFHPLSRSAFEKWLVYYFEEKRHGK